MTDPIEADVAAVDRIQAVPTILEVVCRTTGMGFAAIARVTEDRWVACAVRDDIQFGLQPGGELRVETTLCHEIRQSREPIVINNVAEDSTYCGHHTPAQYKFQSYISMPIVLPDGTFFGTLCAIDPRPARLNMPEVVGMFRLFAELIAFHLDTGEKLAANEADLSHERRTAELREQFIAVLGHDLRNPLASIDAGAKLLRREPLSERALTILGMLQNSVGRMAELIDNVLDFARGRLGDGMVLNRTEARIEQVIGQIVDELRATHPDRRVETALSLARPIRCDPARIGQLLSNLVGNALSHGAAGQPVRVRAATDAGVFELSVANSGDPIPPATIERLFQPFFRMDARPGQEGLGLGLYIAHEIARAHGGTIDVSSTPEETCFTFRMQLD